MQSQNVTLKSSDHMHVDNCAVVLKVKLSTHKEVMVVVFSPTHNLSHSALPPHSMQQVLSQPGTFLRSCVFIAGGAAPPPRTPPAKIMLSLLHVTMAHCNPAHIKWASQLILLKETFFLIFPLLGGPFCKKKLFVCLKEIFFFIFPL